MNIRQKYAFISTFIFGLAAHGMMLFNKYCFHDDLRYIFTGAPSFPLGRWMLYVLGKTEKNIHQYNVYSIPVFNGFFTFLCIAAALCLLIDLFEIRSKHFCILLSGIMVTIPVITCMFGYMFAAHYYAFSILLAVFGSWLILKKDRWYHILIAIVILACSVGVYQAYIPTILSVLLFGLFKMFTEAETIELRKHALKKTAVILISCIAFFALYVGILILCLHLTGLELSGYLGINTARQISLSIYFKRVLTAYREFFFLSKISYFNVFPGFAYILYRIMVLLFMGMLAYQAFCALKKSRINGTFLLLFTLLAPLCINFIFVMVKVSGIYAMTSFSYTILFVVFVFLAEKMIGNEKSRFARLSAAALKVVLGLMVIIFFRYDNACYVRLEFSMTQAIRYYSTLVTRIQSVPGYRQDMRVVYIGQNLWSVRDTTLAEESEFDKFINTHPYWGLRSFMGNSEKLFMEIWFDFKPREGDKAYFENLPEVMEMPHYPDDGSVKVVEDTVVVKY